MANEVHEERKKVMGSLYGKSCQVSNKTFYDFRIKFILERHNFVLREEMLGMVLSAAMGDRNLSVSDMLYVISKVEEAHQKSMEMNYNEK